MCHCVNFFSCTIDRSPFWVKIGLENGPINLGLIQSSIWNSYVCSLKLVQCTGTPQLCAVQDIFFACQNNSCILRHQRHSCWRRPIYSVAIPLCVPFFLYVCIYWTMLFSQNENFFQISPQKMYNNNIYYIFFGMIWQKYHSLYAFWPDRFWPNIFIYIYFVCF